MGEDLGGGSLDFRRQEHLNQELWVKEDIRRPGMPISHAVPGWAASGTGSEDSERERRRRASETTRRVPSRPVGGSTSTGALDRSTVTDVDGAVGGALGAAERVQAPTRPAAAAKQHAVYGDDSDDEPPPL